jgi:hypothetical protein
VIVSAVTFVVFGFRPLTIFGYTVWAVILLLGIVILVGISGAGASFGAQIALPTHTPTFTPTQTLTGTPTSTPQPPTATATQTLTPIPPTTTSTPTNTLSPTPTPIVALVDAEQGGGAHLRAEPGFQAESIRILANGTPVQVLSADPMQVGGGIWVNVRTNQGDEGWILQILLVTATPSPDWEG